MRLLLSVVFCSVVLVLGHTAFAVDEESFVKTIEFQKKITDINRLKPLQNPRHEKSIDVLNRHVLDTKSKIVGEVDDILLDHDGQVSSLFVSFDRLRLGQSVYLNYEMLDIKSVTAGYRLGFNRDEIEDVYPELLSSIDTASGGGEDGENLGLYSVKALLGSVVMTSDNKTIGKVQDILFNQDGTYVRSVYLNVSYKTIHDKGVAVPLSVLKFEQKYGQTRAVIETRYVDMILKYAKEG